MGRKKLVDLYDPSCNLIHLLELEEDVRKRKRSRKERKRDLWLTFDKRCAYCGKPLTLDAVTRDHVVPRDHGGSSHETNLVPSCLRCNGSKGNHPVLKWFPKQDSYHIDKMLKIIGITGIKALINDLLGLPYWIKSPNEMFTVVDPEQDAVNSDLRLPETAG